MKAAATVEIKVKQINARLKAALVPVSVMLRGKSLYLRSSNLPPKPGDSPSKRYEIPMGPASQELLVAIESQAHRIWSDVVTGRFDWTQYDRGVKAAPETVADWVKRFEDAYLAEGRGAQETFDKFWRGEVLGRLPQTEKLTTTLLMGAVMRTPVNSRLRRLTCQKLQKFAQFAGIEIELSPFQGNYGSKSVAPRDLPTDEQIEAWYLQIPRDDWRMIFARIAVFGLRPSEAFAFEVIDQYTARVVDAKSKKLRITKAFHPEWAERWPMNGQLPPISTSAIKGSAAGQISDRIRNQFYRYGIKCERYDLRHGWCVRVSVEYKIPTPVVAKWAGHAEDVHLKIYNRWIRLDQQDQVYREMALRRQAGGDAGDLQE